MSSLFISHCFITSYRNTHYTISFYPIQVCHCYELMVTAAHFEINLRKQNLKIAYLEYSIYISKLYLSIHYQ